MKTRRLLVAVLAAVCLVESAIFAYQTPYVHDRLAWRLEILQADIRGRLFPHPDTISTPDLVRMAQLQATLTAMAPTSAPTLTRNPDISQLPSVTPTATAWRAPVPDHVLLEFSRYEAQGWNNCGPASLSMMLRFWGWQGSQKDTANWLKPNKDDKNTMLYELEQYVKSETFYGITLRTGGSFDDLRALIAAGFPPVIEIGMTVPGHGLGWMGHYVFLVGYDNNARQFVAEDSYYGPDYAWDYDTLLQDWRSFNFLYLVAYPYEREPEVLALLGPNADLEYNRQYTLDLAKRETETLQGDSLTYAYFNVGTSYVAMQEYPGAVLAYDQARFLGLPYRYLWYQTGPYFAYYYTGRYQDVVDLASATLDQQENLEESWYWRGMARMQLGDRDGAISDWQQALVIHPGFSPAVYQLQQAGVL